MNVLGDDEEFEPLDLDYLFFHLFKDFTLSNDRNED